MATDDLILDLEPNDGDPLLGAHCPICERPWSEHTLESCQGKA